MGLPARDTIIAHNLFLGISIMGVPSFSGRGGQDRARGRHLTAANTLSAFGRFNLWGGGGGGGGVLSAFGQFNQWEGGGGGVLSLSASSINQVSALSADSTSGRWRLSYGGGGGGGVRMYVNKGGGGRH